MQTKPNDISQTTKSLTKSLRTWAWLDMGALESNVRRIQSLLPDHCQFMAVVKANAYGHGAIPMARHLAGMGIRDFAVATLDEGIALRKHKIPGNILILGYTPAPCAHTLHKYALTQTVADLDHARALSNTGVPLDIHIKVDTGMHRLGVACDDFASIEEIIHLPGLRTLGIFSHLCCADSETAGDIQFTRAQISRFLALRSQLRACGYESIKTHIASSYGAVNYPDLPCDHARIGIMMYGALSSRDEALARRLCLRPVLSLHSRIASIRQIGAGESVGYGRTYTSRRAMTIAVIPIGYADGYPRSLSNKGHVLIHGRRAPIIGRICMDQLTLDISDIPDASDGDTVTLMGRDGQEAITAEDLAALAGTITNELLCRLGPRITRLTMQQPKARVMLKTKLIS